MQIRAAHPDDIPSIQSIYAREVLTGTASFELEAPDVDEMARRFKRIRESAYPYFVAVLNDRIAGYAYAAAYRPRPAYRWTVENSVYVADWARRRGVGSALLETLIRACTDSGFRQMLAVIGDSAHLASIELHRRAGFEPAGIQKAVGYKFGRWLDTVQMQRALGPGARGAPGNAGKAGPGVTSPKPLG